MNKELFSLQDSLNRRGYCVTQLIPKKPGGEILLYQTGDGQSRIDVRMQAETVWLSLNQMAELFQRDKSLISRHIKSIFAEEELERQPAVANFATAQKEGDREVTRDFEYFNLA